MTVELVGRTWKHEGRDVVYDETNRDAVTRYLEDATSSIGSLTTKLDRAKLEYVAASKSLRDAKAVLYHLRNLPDEKAVKAAKTLRKIAFGGQDHEWDLLAQERKDFYLAEAKELLEAIGVQ